MAVGVEEAKVILLDPSQPLDVRIRALYAVKQLKSFETARILMQAIDTTDSVLLQHELLYNIGQFGSDECLHALQEVALASEKYNEVSRHEAIEAIGAIAHETSLPFLDTLASDEMESAPVRESCSIAAQRIRLKHELGDEAYAALRGPHFESIDPAPPSTERDVPLLAMQLMDTRATLFERYRAMFALRDINSPDSVAALAAALRDDGSSALFRHEIAFVLGQLEAPSTIPALVASLKDDTEHPMVRHESAEALGAMADTATWDLLAAYSKDPDPLVRDSCEVALEMHRYWSQWKSPESLS